MSQRTSLTLNAIRGSISSLAIVCALAGSVRAQGFCFEDAVPALSNTPMRTFTIGDLSGDGLPDVVYTFGVASSVPGGIPFSMSVALNLGDGTFGTPTQLYLATDTIEELPTVLTEDVDGDGDLDLVVLSARYVLGPTSGAVGIWINNGAGTFAFSAWYGPLGQVPYAIVAADIDGDSDVDILCTAQVQAGIAVLRNNGAGTFTTTSIAAPCSCSVIYPTPGDVDGDGDLDLVVSTTTGTYVMLNSGSGTYTSSGPFQLGGGFLVDLDGDGDLDLPDVFYSQGYHLTVYLNQGNGTFVSGWTGSLPTTEGTAWADVDGDGDVDFVGTGAGAQFLLNQGNATFGSPMSVPGTSSLDVHVADLDGDGDADVLTGGSNANGLVLFRGCRVAGTPFCAGDGSGTACPCGNASAVGADAGCSNSLGTAGVMRGIGIARISSDSFVLAGSGMSNSGALYFQGTARVAAGAGAVFGDGLRCAGGAIVRLATKTNVAGASRFPAAGDPSLSVRGMVTTPGTRTYQVWYRNAAAFCTPSTFNLTNGLEVTWGN